MPKFLAKLLARIIFKAFRWWILNRNDKAIARAIKITLRIIYALTADEYIRQALSEAVEIFEQGGRQTEIVRQMLEQADAEYATAILASILRRD